jgi:cell division protein FtsW
MAFRSSGDKTLFFTTSFLTLFGLVMMYSASSVVASSQHDGMSSYYFVRQLVYAIVGFIALIFLMKVNYHVWQNQNIVRLLIIVCIIGLALVFTQPKVNAAHRWLRYGSFISFQPSEIAKLVLLLFMAVFLQKREQEINNLKSGLVPCAIVIGLFAVLIGIEPDLGQALCIVLIAAVMLFAAGLSWKYMAATGLLGLPAFYFFVVRVPFRWDRIKSFLNPFSDPLGAGWQISQSLTAVGSGGMWGVGFGEGRQKLFFLPEAQSDFIFAVIGEELGLAGACLIVVAFLLFFYRGMKITLKAPDRFGFYMGLGITLMVALQAFINMSMTLAMLPTKGIALPFISQGGSSLLLNLLATGVLLNISHYGEQS